MHSVLTWDNNGADTEREKVDAQVLAALQPYSWVRPLKSAVVVNLPSEDRRVALQADLTERSKTINNHLIFVLGPLTSGGQYLGYMPPDVWPKLNALSAA